MPGAATARALAAQSRHESTQAQYGRLFEKFADYCELAGVSALPASRWTIFNYVGYLADEGRWAADSLQPIFSAINAAHRDLDLDPPACDNHFLTQARKGLRRAQVQAGHTRDTRVPLPCEHALTILEAGEGVASGGIDSPEQLHAVRRAFGLLLTALFAGRQDSGVHLRTEDFGFDEDHIWLRLTEKGKKGMVVRRVLKLHVSRAGGTSAVPRVRALGASYLAARSRSLRVGQSEPEFLLQLPGERRPVTRDMESWLAFELRAAGISAPAGFAYQGHSIRSMAASAMAAIGVSRPTYIFIGGWARGSTVVDKHYIDPTFAPSAATRALYGWLLEHAYDASLRVPERGEPLPDPWLHADGDYGLTSHPTLLHCYCSWQYFMLIILRMTEKIYVAQQRFCAGITPFPKCVSPNPPTAEYGVYR